MKSNRDNPMVMPYNMGMPGMYPNMPNTNDLEIRLSSIERQLKRLDSRISRLETNGLYNQDNIGYNTSLNDNYSNMYPNSMHMM